MHRQQSVTLDDVNINGVTRECLNVEAEDDDLKPVASASPSHNPDGGPSGAPSTSPTGGPTGSPTTSPNAFPTASPTASPTGIPTGIPTGVPTASPTASPAGGPTGSPTAAQAVSSTGCLTFAEISLSPILAEILIFRRGITLSLPTMGSVTLC